MLYVDKGTLLILTSTMPNANLIYVQIPIDADISYLHYLSIMDILLTNDDGINANGIWALYHVLSKFANVTIIAPSSDMSGVGRQTSKTIQIELIDEGYAVSGTPADCVILGLSALKLEPDLVISGCNCGANVGFYSIGRSGTISAAIESTFLGVPSISSSLFIPIGEFPRVPTIDEYQNAANATAYLAQKSVELGLIGPTEYLNVNSPIGTNSNLNISLTLPSTLCNIRSNLNDDGSATIHDHVWADIRDGKVIESNGTDRQTIMNDVISVSHLSPVSIPTPSTILNKIISSY